MSKAPIYAAEQAEGLRTAGRFNAQLMDFLRPHVKAGVTTAEIDRLAYDYTRDHGHIPACLGYKGYPRTICSSVNEVVCHGIPNERPLVEGDIVNVDITTIVHGWYGDQSETFLIEPISADARKLVQVTFEALHLGIRAIRPYGRISDIGRAIFTFAHEHGFSVVREYQGHGIGRDFHQEPSVPHFPERNGQREVIRPGMCFTVEPMLNAGTWRTMQDKKDGWTVRTKDGRLSAQFEHTIFVNEDGPEVLTVTQHGPQPGHRF